MGLGLISPVVLHDELLPQVIDALCCPRDLELGLATWPSRNLEWGEQCPPRCTVTSAPFSFFSATGPTVGSSIFKTEDLVSLDTLFLPFGSTELMQVRCLFRSALSELQVQELQMLLDDGYGQVLCEEV